MDLNDPVYLALRTSSWRRFAPASPRCSPSTSWMPSSIRPRPRPATPIVPPKPPAPGVGGDSATSFANETGCPDLIVPAGMTKEGLPVTISFFGPQWSEAKLLGYGYDFEQATKAIVLPKNTPALPSDTIGVLSFPYEPQGNIPFADEDRGYGADFGGYPMSVEVPGPTVARMPVSRREFLGTAGGRRRPRRLGLAGLCRAFLGRPRVEDRGPNRADDSRQADDVG